MNNELKAQMKTRTEIRQYAKGLAWEQFYSDDDVPWQPFEQYPDEWLENQCVELTNAIEAAMLWAQGAEK